MRRVPPRLTRIYTLLPYPTLFRSGVGDYRAVAGMVVRDVVHRVLVAFRQRQIDVEYEFGVGPALDQEVAHRVAAHPVDQVAQGDVAAGPLEIGRAHV